MFQVEKQGQKALHHHTPSESLGSLLTLSHNTVEMSFQSVTIMLCLFWFPYLSSSSGLVNPLTRTSSSLRVLQKHYLGFHPFLPNAKEWGRSPLEIPRWSSCELCPGILQSSSASGEVATPVLTWAAQNASLMLCHDFPLSIVLSISPVLLHFSIRLLEFPHW